MWLTELVNYFLLILYAKEVTHSCFPPSFFPSFFIFYFGRERGLVKTRNITPCSILRSKIFDQRLPMWGVPFGWKRLGLIIDWEQLGGPVGLDVNVQPIKGAAVAAVSQLCYCSRLFWRARWVAPLYGCHTSLPEIVFCTTLFWNLLCHSIIFVLSSVSVHVSISFFLIFS